MALSTQPYKGARDFYPEDKRLQKYLFSVMRSVVERYGYEEYDAPIIESLELYLAKTGEEIVNEQTYSFVDRGNRHVVIRPEMTPSVSRMVAAKRQELAYPLRWYSIPNLWRYERPQRGRLREHWQLNVDLFDVKGLRAELEIIQVAVSILKAYGANPDTYEIRLNSRKLIDHIFKEYLQLNDVQAQMLSKLLDRSSKLDHQEFKAQSEAIFSPSQRDKGLPDKFNDLLTVKKLQDLPDNIKNHQSVNELKQLMDMLEAAKLSNYIFDISLMRGFDYYTDIVFEIFDKDPDNNRSMFGGGRYDSLIGLFGVETIESVGFGMGDVTLLNFLDHHQLTPKLPAETEAYVVLIGDVQDKANKVIDDLREMGLNIAVDYTSRKTDSQIKTAVKKGINYVIFIGEDELIEDQYMLKNLNTGKSEKHSTQRIVSIIKDFRI